MPDHDAEKLCEFGRALVDVAGELAVALTEAAKTIAAIAEAFREWLRIVRKELAPMAARICEGLRLIPRKWLRIWRHTKKRRIKKKYEARIWGAIVSAFI